MERFFALLEKLIPELSEGRVFLALIAREVIGMVSVHCNRNVFFYVNDSEFPDAIHDATTCKAHSTVFTLTRETEVTPAMFSAPGATFHSEF